jgi:hypothetical protein
MLVLTSYSQEVFQGKFEQLDDKLPTPNSYRTGGGEPGPDYWQQQADYDIEITLDDVNHRITGNETIKYYNNSPNTLKYLWVQLDQNVRAPGSDKMKTRTTSDRFKRSSDTLNANQFDFFMGQSDFDGGFKIMSVTNTEGQDLEFIINKTMMRIDLDDPMKPGDTFSFNISWWYNINSRFHDFSLRSGWEYFPDDDNYLYAIAQFYPRMCVYDDFNGWQNKQFYGWGEFALEFGDFNVRLTVPKDYVVAATGELQNPGEVLTKEQLVRFNRARETYDEQVFIITEEEAIENEKRRTKGTNTWEFSAEDVRDFAFATSRKFIWDAMAVDLGDKKPLAMSYYPKEGNPLWEKESTIAVKNTLITYSRMTIPYPYPVAISVHSANIGMEYPMISFNPGRPNPDGTYSERTRWACIGVTVHEVGHNFFPMIINSDERQWTWMDEGLNSFMDNVTQIEWYPDFVPYNGTPSTITNYMKGDKSFIRPIMTNSEQITQWGNNAYSKPSASLFLLRNTIMGRMKDLSPFM